MLGKKDKGYLEIPNNNAAIEPSSPTGNVTSFERWVITKLSRLMGNPKLRFRLWDNSEVTTAEDDRSAGVMHLTNRRTFWRFIRNPGLHFGDDYSTGNILIEGNLADVLEAIFTAREPANQSSLLERYAINRPTWMRRNSLSGSKKNIYHHYDLGNDFYRLWLDDEMVYTCAYFPEPDVSLEAAQIAKMEHVCRKLRLKQGETVVEAGCGWGSLALYMAKNYGVKVTAYNISKEQIKFARERAKQENLDHLLTYVEDDYRNIEGNYDVFVSVGMMEHIGQENQKKFRDIINTTLSKTGRGLIHTIAQNEPRPVNPWIRKRIFPGGYLPTLHEIANTVEPIGCAVVDVENLRLHYAKTLEHWLTRFNQHEDTITRMYDKNFVRAWRLYLTASMANFSSNSIQLYQCLFTRIAANDVAWTRAYLYD